jgi:glyoxylase-like metal-dependent hydrolase (beta-lactamase superfamily II)
LNAESYGFKVGSFECAVVLDGTHTYPEFAKRRFHGVPQEQLKQALRNYGLNLDSAYESPYPALVVNTGQNLVLVDTGAGDLFPSTGRLISNLRAIDIEPQDIDTVVLTHGHPDHIGGILDSEGNLAFPNASYYMWKTEWEFWYPQPDPSGIRHESPVKEMLIESARRHLPPIGSRLELIDREMSVVPGIYVLAAPGHTLGHMAVKVISEGRRLLFVSDAIAPLQIEHPEWYSAYDYDPEQVVATRRRLLELASSEKALVQIFHFPFPGIGRVTVQGNAWRWNPLAG